MSTFSSNKESSFKIWLKTGRQESHRAETKVKMSSDWWIRMTANGICRICDKDDTHFLCGKWLGWPTLRQWCSFLSLAPFSVIYRTASCVLIVGHVSYKHRQISNETQICLLACKSKSTVEWSSTIDICHCSPESNPKQETTTSQWVTKKYGAVPIGRGREFSFTRNESLLPVCNDEGKPVTLCLLGCANRDAMVTPPVCP